MCFNMGENKTLTYTLKLEYKILSLGKCLNKFFGQNEYTVIKKVICFPLTSLPYAC